MKFELTKEEWLNNLEVEFNSQTPEEINFLLSQCTFNLSKDMKVTSIIKTIRKSEQISFKQWKALKASLYEHKLRINNPTKNI